MTTDKQPYKVFISSTYLDNVKRRQLVQDAVQRAEMLPIGMERFTASSNPTIEECERKARECDVYVGIIAHRYGCIPKGKDRSFTELEYDAAKGAGRPCLMFEIDRSIPIDSTKDYDEGDDWWKKQGKLHAFRAKYRGHQMPAPFTEETLGVTVLDTLNRQQRPFTSRTQSPTMRAQSPARPKPWMLAAMIDKKLQSKHLWRTTERTRRLAYFLMGHQREWPEALAYRLALDITAEDIASFRPPERLCIRNLYIEDGDRVRDSLYKGLAGKLQVARDQTIPLVDRLCIRLTEEKDPLVFFVSLPTNEEPNDIATALTVLLQAWEELLAPIRATVRHFLVLTLDVVPKRVPWFSFRRPRDTFERFAAPCRAVIEESGLDDVNLPALCSPTREDVVAWVNECVESFHQSQAEEVRDDVLALFEARDEIPHNDLKTLLVPLLEKIP